MLLAAFEVLTCELSSGAPELGEVWGLAVTYSWRSSLLVMRQLQHRAATEAAADRSPA